MLFVRRYPRCSANQIRLQIPPNGNPGEISKQLRRLKNLGLIRIQYNPECVYTLTDLGYDACAHYATQEHPVCY